MSDIMTKISKVLKQAENAATPEEAEAFFAAAQQMGAKYNIDLAIARQHTQQRERREEPVRRSIQFDTGRNTKKHFVNLYSTIAQHNDLKMDIRGDSTGVYPYGFPSDQDVAEAIFASVSVHMVEEANKFIASGGYKAETQTRVQRYKDYNDYGWHNAYDGKGPYDWSERVVHKPVDGRTARANFYEGYIRTLGRRLLEAYRAAKAEVVAESSLSQESTGALDPSEATTGVELALIEKTEEVHSFYKANSRARGSWNGPSSSGFSSTATMAGGQAAQRARIGSSAAMGGAKAIGS
jgi:hypothetical protein